MNAWHAPSWHHVHRSNTTRRRVVITSCGASVPMQAGSGTAMSSLMQRPGGDAG
jgi:hypothetical protein